MVGCIQGMLRDLTKVNRIKNSQFESRSIWCLGIHPAASRDDVQRRSVTTLESTV